MEKILYILLGCLLVMNSRANVIINEVMATNVEAITTESGETSDWVELYNTGANTVSLEHYYLSDEEDNLQKWALPAIDLEAGAYLLVWASGLDMVTDNELHTNFKVSSSGETVYLTHEMDMVDASPAWATDPDVSLGRTLDDMTGWYYYAESTPGTANTSLAYEGQAEMPVFSHAEGFYSEAIMLELIANDTTDQIHYTLNGIEPTSESPLYTAPIEITQNTVLRLLVTRENHLPSRVGSYTYLFDTDLSLGVVSLITTPSNLFGNGIYDAGDGGIEKPIHMTYFEQDHTLAFKLDMGVKMHAMPDNRPQKSMRLYARAKYGTKKISYPIFEDKDISEFKTLVLRNGGNDAIQSNKTAIRDVFTHSLYQQQNPENGMASHKAVHVYINGSYWGIYYMRERQDEHYMESNFGYSEEEVHFLEYDYQEPSNKKTISGDWEDWEDIKAILLEEDMSVTANYEEMKARIDIDNFIDYQLYEIFIGNQDWLNNNIKFWRPKAEGGKWKWVLWDTDYALGTQKDYPVGNPNFNFLDMAINWGGWGNGNWTWMLKGLLANEEFKHRFSIRFLDLLNTTFKAEYTLAHIDKLVDVLAPDIQRQFDRWGSNQAAWDEDLDRVRNFVTERVPYNKIHMVSKLGWSDSLAVLSLDVSDEEAGKIQVNTVLIDENTLGWQEQPYPWDGEYFTDIEVSVTAIPKTGYQFAYWEGDISSTEATLTFMMSQQTTLEAVFEPIGGEDYSILVINEVMASNSSVYPDASGAFEDWIEIYNPGEEDLNLGGLYLSDDLENPTKWQIPMEDASLTTIPADGYLTFFADSQEEEGVLHTNFKLKQSGESIGLFIWNEELEEAETIDDITYSEQEEDTSYGRLPNGGEDWTVFTTPTPNAKNEIIVDSEDHLVDIKTSVYPNPVKEKLFVEIGENHNQEYMLKLKNVYGQIQLIDFVRTNGAYQLDVSDIIAGTYALILQDKAGRIVATHNIVVVK